MYTSNLRKVGGSVMLAVPPAILEMLQMESGLAYMAVESGRLVIEPNVRKKYSLQELLAQCDASAPLSGEDGVWTGSSSTGRELL